MKNYRLFFLMFFATLFCCDNVVAIEKADSQIKIISFNIRTISRDGANNWENRKHATKNMLELQKPDVFGLQEAMKQHLFYIDEACPQYARVGVGRDDGKMGGEIMAVYYNKERFDLLDSGTFWLSETPEKVSRGWDAVCNRTATWVYLRDKITKRKIYYFNTHLDHKGRVAQTEAVKLIMERITKMTKKRSVVILGGDFNVEADDEIMLPLYEKMKSARNNAVVSDNKATFNGFGSVKRKMVIDHLFYRGRVKCLKLKTLDGDFGAKYISDHYPLEMVIQL